MTKLPIYLLYLLYMKSLQLEKPHAIVVVGIQGSGKSFFAEKFADTFTAPFLDDKQFIEHAKTEGDAKMIATTMLLELLKTGKSIVIEIDGSKDNRIELAKLLKDSGYQMLLVWVQTDSNTAMARARKMNGTKQDEYREGLKQFSAPQDNEQPLVISGKHTFASQTKAVLKKLSATNRPPIFQGRNTIPAQQRTNIVVS